MPIANCIIAKKYQETIDSSNDLIEIWASESSKPPEHMTINIIFSDNQFGKKYGIMANLFLPTIWSDEDISLLQLGLSAALSRYYKAPLSDVHVITTHVNSGLVVEEGKELQW